MYSFEDQELTGVAFFDVSIYVTHLASVKGLILASDISKGVFFLAFQVGFSYFYRMLIQIGGTT